MHPNPSLTAQMARASHSDLLAGAERHRLSRRARPWPGRRPCLYRAALTALAASLLAASAACAAPPRAVPPRPLSPTFLSPATATFTVGATADFMISTTPPAAAITASGTLPAGVTFRHRTRGGILSGTPARDTGGRYVVVLHARDGAGQASQRLVLTVDQAPQFTTADRDTIIAVAFKHDNTPITATGYPAATITEIGALPAGLTFRSLADGTALISGTPKLLGSPGDFTIVVTAWNPAGSVTKTITVVDVNMVSVCLVVCTVMAGD
jgi:large repetitive protein